MVKSEPLKNPFWIFDEDPVCRHVVRSRAFQWRRLWTSWTSPESSQHEMWDDLKTRNRHVSTRPWTFQDSWPDSWRSFCPTKRLRLGGRKKTRRNLSPLWMPKLPCGVLGIRLTLENTTPRGVYIMCWFGWGAGKIYCLGTTDAV